MAVTRSSRKLSRARRFSLAARLESLETRALLSGIVTYSTGVANPSQLTSDSSGNLWAIETNVGYDKIVKNNGSLDVTTFSPALPGGGQWFPDAIAYSSADNTLWISSAGNSSNGSDVIFHVDTSGNLLGTFAPSESSSFFANTDSIYSLSVAPDGSVWFGSTGFAGATNVSEVGRLNPQTGTFSFATVPNGASTNFLHGAPDGSFWYTTVQTVANSSNTTFSVLSSVSQAKWNGSSIQLTNYNIADSSNEAGDLAIIPANDGNPSDYSIWYTSTTMVIAPAGGLNFDGIHWAEGSTLFPNVPGKLNGIQISNGQPALTQVTLSPGVTQTQLAATTYVIPAGDHSSLLPETLSVDSSGTLWFPEFDAADSSDLFAGSPTAKPITDSLGSFDTTTGTFTRIPMGSEAQGIFSTVAGSDVWVVTFPTNNFQFDNGDFEQLDNVDLTTYTPAITAVTPAIAGTANSLFSGQVAVFASSAAGDFTYTINYGNGTTSTGTIANAADVSTSGITAAADALTSLYTINGSTMYTAAGTYNVSVTIVSASGDVTSIVGQAVVTSVTPLLAQGVSLTGQKDVALAANVTGQPRLVVAQFSGAPASYAATINWGDNTSTTGAIVSLGNNQYVVELPAGKTKTYSAIGNFNVSVAITDGTQTVTATAVATISAVPVVASQNLVLQPLLGPIVLSTVATFTADPLATASWFKATIHWGDGTTSAGLVVRDSAGHFEVIGLHIYSKKGTYSVTTNLVDSVDSETALATASIKIK